MPNPRTAANPNGGGRVRGQGVVRMSVRQAVAASRRAGITPIEVKIYQMKYAHERSMDLREEFEAEEAYVRGKLAEGKDLPAEALDVLFKKLERKYGQMMRFMNMAFERATAAAPYIHPRLASVALEDGTGQTAEAVKNTFEQFANLLDAKSAAKLIEVKIDTPTDAAPVSEE